eukprot:4074195-Alexandrium_andersonii.AAC.1
MFAPCESGACPSWPWLAPPAQPIPGALPSGPLGWPFTPPSPPRAGVWAQGLPTPSTTSWRGSL